MLVSIWAMVFLVIWKRKQYELTYKWNCSDFEDSDELIRPKYVQKAAGRIKYIPGTVSKSDGTAHFNINIAAPPVAPG